MSKCKHYRKMKTKVYNRCLRDNSIRGNCNGCYCPFRKTWFESFAEWISGKVSDFTYWLEGFISGRRK